MNAFKIMILASILIFSVGANAAVLDQENPLSGRGTYGCLIVDTCNWQQEVIVGVTGLLTSITLQIQSPAANTFTLDLFQGGPVNLSTPTNTAFFSIAATNFSPVSIDTSGLGFFVVAGQSFTMSLKALYNRASRVGLSSHSAYAGDLGLDYMGSQEDCYGDCVLDMTFKTYVSGVPVPAAAWLFGSALLGLGAVKRKKTT